MPSHAGIRCGRSQKTARREGKKSKHTNACFANGPDAAEAAPLWATLGWLLYIWLLFVPFLLTDNVASYQYPNYPTGEPM